MNPSTFLDEYPTRLPTCPHLFEYADPIERDFGAASGPEVIR